MRVEYERIPGLIILFSFLFFSLKKTQCIFVTGGSSVIPGLSRRLEREMIALLPFKQEVNIITSWPENPQTEPYKGMRRWAGTEEFKQAAVSRAEWEEMGGDYIKEHRWSNWAD